VSFLNPHSKDTRHRGCRGMGNGRVGGAPATRPAGASSWALPHPTTNILSLVQDSQVLTHSRPRVSVSSRPRPHPISVSFLLRLGLVPWCCHPLAVSSWSGPVSPSLVLLSFFLGSCSRASRTSSRRLGGPNRLAPIRRRMVATPLYLVFAQRHVN
jgi:hypothetical protein